jgi:PRA1 family protein 1
MARISIPIDMVTSRFNIGDRFESLRSQSLSSRFSNMRSLMEFFDVRRISKPNNMGDAQSRLNYNLSYFSSNYAAIFAMLCIYTLITNTRLLFFIFLVIGGLWGIGKLQGQDLVIGSWRASTSQLYTTLLIISVPVFFLSSPWTTAIWLIGASGVTIFGHAIFMDKPIESAFSEEAV